MPVFQELVSFDRMFEVLKTQPIILNNIDLTDIEMRERFNTEIITSYSSDFVTLLPSCHCGSLKGELHIGEVCQDCGTEVVSDFEANIEPTVWLKKPDGVEKFISPVILTLLDRRFQSGVKRSGFSIVNWIIDPSYNANDESKVPDEVNVLLSHGVKRGYNNFVQNFESIIEILFSLKKFKLKVRGKGQNKIQQQDYLYQLIQANQDIIFSDVLPLPNKALTIIENNHTGKYYDSKMVEVIDVARILVGIDIEPRQNKVKERRVAVALMKLSHFYYKYVEHHLGKDVGLFRNQIFASRSHFTARAVITSLLGRHHYDEMHIPWGVACNLLREHILNKLFKRWFDLHAAIKLIMEHTNNFHPLLNEIFIELIAESGNGIEVLLNRNPSLLSGSIQVMRITHVKPNCNDNTFSFHILTFSSFNADLDGDALQITMLLDLYLAGLADRFKPHNNLFELSEPGKMSSNIKIPKPMISTIANWLRSPD